MGLGVVVYSGKLDLNISLRLAAHCSVVQAEEMVVYQTVQWIFINGASFMCCYKICIGRYG